MPEDEDLSRHEEVAKSEARDDKGHFIHVEKPSPEQPQNPQPPQEPQHQNPVSKFLSDHTRYDKSQDDLLDVHVANPLRRIAQLLEDIKRQKAFSFTLKGSLGLAGGKLREQAL